LGARNYRGAGEALETMALMDRHSKNRHLTDRLKNLNLME